MNGKLLSALGRAKSIEESVLHPDWRRDSHVIKYWLLIGRLRVNEYLWGKLEADLSRVSTVNIHVLFGREQDHFVWSMILLLGWETGSASTRLTVERVERVPNVFLWYNVQLLQCLPWHNKTSTYWSVWSTVHTYYVCGFEINMLITTLIYSAIVDGLQCQGVHCICPID